MKAVLVDDEELALEVMERLLRQIDGVTITGMYTRPQDVLEDFEKIEADVVFLDLEMGSIHGLSLAEKLNNMKKTVKIVFITAHSQFALEAFEVDAVDYLLKPVSLDRLKKTIAKLEKRLLLPAEPDKSVMEGKKEIYVHVLGNFRVSDQKGEQVKWRTKKVRELFAYLWHQQEQPVNRARIIEDLWGDSPADKAAVRLHTTIYQLRKMLKDMGYPSAISFTNEQYSLNLPVRSDFDELNTLIKRKQGTPDTMERAIALYEGEYFSEEEYTWAFYNQQKFRQDFLQYIEKQLSELQRDNLENPHIEKCFIKMLEVDFYNEDYLYRLLYYYYSINNRSKFISVYEKGREKIKEDLGINLPRKVIELYSQYIKNNI